MRRLMTFSIFESNEIPNHFIKLSSIGVYLDPNDGMTYPMLKNGGYDDDPYPADEFLNEEEEAWGLLSDEEKRLVNSVWRSCEEVVKPLIDWNLIDEIKDVALANEVLDNGLYVKIVVKEQDCSEMIYTEWYGHDKEYKYYTKFFNNLFSQIEKTDGDFFYHISVYRKNGPGGYLPIPKGSKDEIDVLEMIEQVKGMNPDKKLRIFYSKW